jgi:nicotinate-nucleotide adenylyltransferase
MAAATKLRPVGLLGGTFDPVHYGHLRLAEEARDSLGLASVRWIPAGQPPHRDKPRSTPSQRLEMVRAAIAGNAGFILDDAEVRTGQPSYTVVTLERLRRELGDVQPLVVLLGNDAFRGLTTWHRWRELFALAHIAVANRPGSPLDAGNLEPALAHQLTARHSDSAAAVGMSAAGAIVQLNMTPLAVSATDIRARLGAGRSARYLLPDPILDYIERNHLYRTEPHGP